MGIESEVRVVFVFVVFNRFLEVVRASSETVLELVLEVVWEEEEMRFVAFWEDTFLRDV